MQLIKLTRRFITIGLIVGLIEFMFHNQTVDAKKKDAKNKCGIKVVAIEKIKYKFIPVEVPKPNYLLNKQLTNKELKNAWRTFEHSGIRDYQTDNEESSNQEAGEHQTGGYSVVIDQPAKISPLQPIQQIDPNQHEQINLMQPSVIYQRYDKLDKMDKLEQNYDKTYEKNYEQKEDDEDLDEEETRESSEYSKDNYESKDEFRDKFKNGGKNVPRKAYKLNDSTKQIVMPKLKRRSNARRKSRKVFYDYE